MRCACEILDSSCPGLTRASIEKSTSCEEDGLPGHSAFTRVFRRAMPGNDGG